MISHYVSVYWAPSHCGVSAERSEDAQDRIRPSSHTLIHTLILMYAYPYVIRTSSIAHIVLTFILLHRGQQDQNAQCRVIHICTGTYGHGYSAYFSTQTEAASRRGSVAA